MVRLVRVLPADCGAHLIRAQKDRPGRAEPFSRAASRGLRRAFRSPRAWVVAALVALGYAVAYLLVARALVVQPEAHFARFRAVPSLSVAPDLSWRYVLDAFNPAAIAYLSDAIALSLAIPTIATALVIGPLVGANVALAVEMLVQRPAYCATSTVLGFAGALPSFLASFACCAPTVLFVLGANFAVAVVSIVPFVVPVAFALVVASLLWSAARFERLFVSEPPRARAA